MPNKHVKEYPSMQRDALSYNVTIMILETSTFDLHLTASKLYQKIIPNHGSYADKIELL